MRHYFSGLAVGRRSWLGGGGGCEEAAGKIPIDCLQREAGLQGGASGGCVVSGAQSSMGAIIHHLGVAGERETCQHLARGKGFVGRRAERRPVIRTIGL